MSIIALGQQVSFVDYSAQTWRSFRGLALIATILGQTIFNWLLKWLNTSVICMSILGETIGTCILAYIILGEVITSQQAMGFPLILIGLALFLLNKRDLNKYRISGALSAPTDFESFFLPNRILM